MKKNLFIFFILIAAIHSFAQTDSTAQYWKEKVLPAFSLLDKDSVPFTQAILKEDKNIIIMLFNPECDHCQKQLELLLSIPEVSRSAEVVLSSIEPNWKNNIFYQKNHLENYSFVHLGKDYKYLFGKYFRPMTIPVLAFYSKKKGFVLINQGNTSKEVILKAIKD